MSKTVVGYISTTLKILLLSICVLLVGIFVYLVVTAEAVCPIDLSGMCGGREDAWMLDHITIKLNRDVL